MTNNLLGPSWRTSGLGLVLIVQALAAAVVPLLDGKPDTNPNWQEIGAALTAGWALMHARDHKVSSEDAGVK